MGSLFGGEKTSSKNVNNGLLKNAFSGTAEQTGGVSSMLASLLGLSGGPAQDQGFQNFKNSTGYQFGLDQGSQAITGNKAAAGLLNSGSTAKALDKFGQDYGSTKYNDYLSQLFNLGNLGLGAGGILADSGKTSSGSKKPGLGGFVGSILAGQ